MRNHVVWAVRCMVLYHFRRSRAEGAHLGPLVSEVTLSLGAGQARSPRRLSAMIAVYGGRGPDSGPVAPQTAIMERGKAHDHGYGTVGVRPHDRECSLRRSRRAEQVRDHAEGQGRNAGTGPAPRVFLASNCESRVPECFGSCGKLAELDYK